MKYYSIIVGGGTGQRMKSELPKQFLLLNDKPLLMHTIEAFHQSAHQPEIILVLHVEFHSYWEKLCEKYNFNLPHTLVRAGTERFHSVKNGLKAVSGKSIVAIHDAVRPLVSTQLIDYSFQDAEANGNAVAAIQVRDSIRQLTSEGSLSLDRDNIYLIQTPQTFRSEELLKAYRQDYRNEFTDDASVVEKCGIKIRIIEGERSNIKITFPEDIELAELLLNSKKRHQN